MTRLDDIKAAMLRDYQYSRPGEVVRSQSGDMAWLIERLEEAEKENHALRIMYNEETGDGDIEIDAMLKDYVAALAKEERP